MGAKKYKLVETMTKKEALNYKTIIITGTFYNLREALKGTDQEYGLDYYDKREYDRRAKMIFENAPCIYRGYDLQLYYFTGNILHKFNWISCMHSGAAAIVELLPTEIRISEYLFDRNDLRASGCLWTVD